jgi:hypothetical protein
MAGSRTKKAAGKKAKAKKATVKKATAKKTTTRKATKKPAGGVSSLSVNRSHVFALRPRVSPAFRESAFLEAKRFLEDQSYATIEEAARAVVERALGKTNEAGSKLGSIPAARRGRS